MHVQNVSAGEDSLNLGLSVLIDHSTARDAIQGHARALGKLVLGDQADREEQGVAGDVLTGFCNRTAVFVNLCNGNTLKALTAVNFNYGVAES